MESSTSADGTKKCRATHKRKTMGKRLRVLLVDDHEVVRVGLRALIERQPGMEVTGEASTAREAVSQTGRLAPDVVVLDIRLPV
jgi:YesN/AraC family two-component response regulator